MDTPHLFTSKKLLLNNILPPELWDIIFYWKWKFEMKDMNDMNDDKILFNKYIDESDEEEDDMYYEDINTILEKKIPESKLIVTHINSNIVDMAKECTLYIKSLIRWKNYYIIFEYEHEGDYYTVQYIYLSTYSFKFIHMDSYNDDNFLTDKLLNIILLSGIIEYFKNLNRLEDVISYIDKKYIHT